MNVPENLNKFYIISTHIYALNVTFYDVFRKSIKRPSKYSLIHFYKRYIDIYL